MTIIQRLPSFLKFWYYQYLLHSGLYMLESWERTIFTSMLVAFIAMASYTAYLFLPGHLAMLGHFIDHFRESQDSEVNPRPHQEASAPE